MTLGVVERLTGTLPLRLVRGRIAPWMVSVAVEYYYVTQRPPTVSLSGQSNALLDELGVPADAVTHMAGEIGRVLENPTFADGVKALQNLGLLGSGGVQRYVQVAQRINSRPLARRLLGWRLGRILRPYEAGLPGFFAHWLPL